MNFLKQYLSNNNLKMKMGNVKEKFICKICKELLHEAKITPCRCVFCTRCVTSYLENETKECPSCNNNDISISSLMDDYRTNYKISTLSIICPHKDCNENVLMKDIENHILSCQKKTRTCVLSSIGCSNIELSKDEMAAHLMCENENHLKLIVLKISDEKNEKTIFEEETKSKLINLETRQQDMNTELNNVNCHCEAIDSKCEDIDSKCEAINSKCEAIDSKCEDIGSKCEDIDSKYEAIDSKCDGNSQELINLRQQIKAAFETIEEMKTKIETVKNTKSTQTEEEKNKIIQESVSCQTEEEKKSNLIKADWRIIEGRECQVVFTNMNLRARDSGYFSDLFCIEKYCFVMWMYYWSGGDIEVAIHLQRGPFDGEIEWPLKKSIEISLLNKNKVEIKTQFNKDTVGGFKASFNKPGPSRYPLHNSITIKDGEIVDENNLNISIKLIN